ncbi:MAG: hypothetical protein E7423_02915 [Ruminococcaceae bacterium]|nr:hypothetical protein [Oscillospiraceae bacterium]
MAYEEGSSTGMVMPVAPAGYGNGGFGGFGGDGWWIILLFVLLGGGMWGGNGMMGGMGLYPWMNQADITTSGFQNSMLQSNLSGLQAAVTSGFGDVQTALCGGFAGVNATVNGAQNALAQQMYTNQISDLERSYAAQTAVTAGMTGIQSQLAQCCCDNRLATESLRATVLQENCQDRYEAANNTRDIIDSNNRIGQAIIDKLCALEMAGKDSRIADLERQLTMASLAASQNAQTATIQAGRRALANEVEQYVLPTPRPAYVVQNPNCCYNNAAGCGCGNF